MQSFMNQRTFAFIVGLTLMASPAAAQDSFPVTDFGPTISTAMMNSAIASATPSRGPSGAARTSQRTPPAQMSSALSYTPSAARTRANITRFADKTRGVDPRGAAAMEQLFAAQDVMGLAEAEMSKYGLTKNNVADAYTVWWTNAWLASQGRSDDLPRAQLQAVKRQAELAMMGTAEIGRLDDAGKQQFAEALLVQAMLIGASVEAYKEQGKDLAPLKAAVIQGARAFGVNLENLTLTNDGFQTRDR